MVSIKACMRCTDRTYDCHGKCRKYLDERAECERKKKETSKKVDGEHDVEDYTIRKAEAKKRRFRR